jgi:hypothetical protein
MAGGGGGMSESSSSTCEVLKQRNSPPLLLRAALQPLAGLPACWRVKGGGSRGGEGQGDNGITPLGQNMYRCTRNIGVTGDQQCGRRVKVMSTG